MFSGSSSFKDDARLDPLIMKRKRGRPRILDAPGEINPFAQTRISIEVHNAILLCYSRNPLEWNFWQHFQKV